MAASKSRWTCDAAVITDDTPTEAVFHFPGGLSDYLKESTDGHTMVTKDIFSWRVEKEGGHGSVEWALGWTASHDGFVHSYCNTIPTPEGGTHELGLKAALTRGLKSYGEMVNNKKAAQIIGDDVFGTATAMLSVFIREPEFQGQTKDKLARKRPAASLRQPFGMPSTTGWSIHHNRPPSFSTGPLNKLKIVYAVGVSVISRANQLRVNCVCQANSSTVR